MTEIEERMEHCGRGEGERTVAVLGSALLDGQELSPRQRSLIAGLTFHRSAGATTGMLIDAVWGTAAPGSARQSLQNQIARIRQRFGNDAIVTDGFRYRLGRPCDVDSFERLIGPWVGGPADVAAIPELERGLALWRGIPFEDLEDHEGAEAERACLAELRCVAAERLAACRIASGDLCTAIGSLTGLVETEPYRERGWELLILSLHLSGRRTDALATYQRLAARLTAELRCQPSAAIQRLHAAVDRDEVLDLRTPPSESPSATTSRVSPCGRPQQRQRTGCSGRYRHA